MSPPVLLVPEKINPALIEAIRGEGLGRLEIDERLKLFRWMRQDELEFIT